MLEDGLSYPLNGDNALARIVIGGLLGFGSFLIIPAFALMGYLVWVLGGAARGEEEPPAFENWGEMIVDGLKATVVALVYGIIPFALVFVSMFVIAGGGASGSDAPAGILGGVGILGMLVSLVAMFLLYYLIPAALTNMALEDEFAAAFDFSTIKQAVLSVDYLVAWLIPFLLAAVVNVVVFALAITVVGLIVVPFLQFYVQVAAFYMFGAAFRKVVNTDGASATGQSKSTAI
jgi:hypothetical protein